MSKGDLKGDYGHFGRQKCPSIGVYTTTDSDYVTLAAAIRDLDEAQTVWSARAVNTTLTRLSLRDNYIMQKGGLAIAEVVRWSTLYLLISALTPWEIAATRLLARCSSTPRCRSWT